MNRQVNAEPFDISGRTATNAYNAATAFDLGVMNGKGSYSNAVQPSTSDYFKFKVSTDSNVTLGIAGTGVNLELFPILSDDQLGTAIAVSADMLLDPGSYAVKVSATTQANLSYTLNVLGTPKSTDLLGVTFSAAPTVALNPSSANTPNFITTTFTVKNNGSTVMRDVAVGFLISRDSQIQPTSSRDVRLLLDSNLAKTYTLANPLAPGETSTPIEVKLRLPDTSDKFWYADGDYTIGMVIDPDNTFSETNENNNFNVALGIDKATLKITGTDTLELIGSDFQKTGGTFGAGEIITASFTVSNIGNRAVAAGLGLPIQFYLSRDSTIEPGSDAILTVAYVGTDIAQQGFTSIFIDPVAGGTILGVKGSGSDSKTIQVQIQLPTLADWTDWGTGSGTFYLSSWLDPDGKIAQENDVANNKIEPELVGTPDDTIGNNYLKFTLS
jgi:hypothetical protein